MTDIPAAVQLLIDRQAIRDCLATYCRGVDRLDREMLLSVYHPDAIDDHGVFVGGPEAFADWVYKYHSIRQSSTQHIITNHTCEVNGDVAHAETYWMMAAMNNEGSPLSLSGGRYIDRLEKRNGEWRIAARLCVSDWHGDPGPSAAPPEVRQALNNGGTPARDRTDPSYLRPLKVRSPESVK